MPALVQIFFLQLISLIQLFRSSVITTRTGTAQDIRLASKALIYRSEPGFCQLLIASTRLRPIDPTDLVCLTAMPSQSSPNVAARCTTHSLSTLLLQCMRRDRDNRLFSTIPTISLRPFRIPGCKSHPPNVQLRWTRSLQVPMNCFLFISSLAP